MIFTHSDFGKLNGLSCSFLIALKISINNTQIDKNYNNCNYMPNRNKYELNCWRETNKSYTSVPIFFTLILNFLISFIRSKTMKLIKRILFGAAFIAAGAAFAQKSMMNESSFELFGSDVDDFMDVNEYHNVQPENLFGYIGYGKEGKGNLELGAAHQFKNFYFGAWFGGQLNSWTSSINIDKDKKWSFENKSTTTNAANGKLIFGMNNMGILADVKFTPKGSTYETDPVNKTKTTTDKFNLVTDLKFGINLTGKNDMVFKTWGLLGLDSNVDKYTKTTDGKIASPSHKKDKSIYQFKLGAGTSFDFMKKDMITQSFGVGLNTTWYAYANQDAEKTFTRGQFNGKMVADPSWTVTFEPTSRFMFKTKLGLEGTTEFKSDFNYIETNGVKAYNVARVHSTTIKIEPNFAFGGSYQVLPEKLSFNAGIKLNVPEFGWTFSKTEARDAGNGNVKSTTSSAKFEFTTKDGKVTTSSGLTWMPVKNITVDAKWDILTDLFDNFSSKVSGGDKSIWNTVNTIFVHKFAFLLSVKL